MKKKPTYQKQKDAEEILTVSPFSRLPEDEPTIPSEDTLTPEDFPEFMEIRKRLSRKGRQKEVKEFISACRPTIEREGFLKPFDNEGAVTEAGKWLLSLHLLDAYLERGEGVALKHLPFALQLDRSFFLGQRWVRELVADWHTRGERKKIERLFFGTPKRGMRSFELTMENQQRDIRIAAAVSTLLTKGCGYNEAMRTVSKNLSELGIKDRLSPANVRRIYENVRKGRFSFIRLFDPR